jgi:hypothetical protein
MRALYWLMLAIPLAVACDGGDDEGGGDDKVDDVCEPTSRSTCEAACSHAATICEASPEEDMANLDVDACVDECVAEPWDKCFVSCITEADDCNIVLGCDEEPGGSDTAD